MTPTTSTRNLNYFAVLADDDDDDTDDDEIDGATDQANRAFAPRHITDKKSALSDSGATSHFIVDGAHVTNKQVALNPITITLPDGSTLHSTHTCNVNIPWL